MRFLYLVLSCIFCSMIFAKEAWAYIDPATGSMLIQAVLATIAAVSVSVGVFWRRLRAFFSKIMGKKDAR